MYKRQPLYRQHKSYHPAVAPASSGHRRQIPESTYTQINGLPGRASGPLSRLRTRVSNQAVLKRKKGVFDQTWYVYSINEHGFISWLITIWSLVWRETDIPCLLSITILENPLRPLWLNINSTSSSEKRGTVWQVYFTILSTSSGAFLHSFRPGFGRGKRRWPNSTHQI